MSGRVTDYGEPVYYTECSDPQCDCEGGPKEETCWYCGKPTVPHGYTRKDLPQYKDEYGAWHWPRNDWATKVGTWYATEWDAANE